MGRYGNGGTLLKVRSGTMILGCVLGASLSSSSVVYGLSVDPLLDGVLSVTRLNEAETTPTADKKQALSKSEDKPRPATANVSPDDIASIPVAAHVPISVIAEPLEVVPSIDTFDRQQRIARFSEPVPRQIDSLAVASVVSESKPSSILRSSDHGWKIFGVPWYVWGLAGAGSAYATRRVLQSCFRRALAE